MPTRTIHEFDKLFAWFAVQNTLYGFTKKFHEETTKKLEVLVEEICQQFGVKPENINLIGDDQVLIGKTSEAFDNFKELIESAKRARENI